MSDGTPLDALETGDVEHSADAQRMSEILQDINSSGAEVVSQQPSAPLGGSSQPMGPMPPMYTQQQMYAPQMQAPPSHYIPVDEPPRPRKKNMWSSITSGLRDPLLVSILFFALSLPVLHTYLAKYVHWAFAVGGQLSWLGLIALSIVGGVLFGVGQGISQLAGF
jgi:hypothetical protein